MHNALPFGILMLTSRLLHVRDNLVDHPQNTREMLKSPPLGQVQGISAPRVPTIARRVSILMASWYISSSVAVVLTKILFSGSPYHRPFPFSLTVTATNNVVAAVLSSLSFTLPANVKRESNINRIALIIGASTAAEIGLSNLALNLLSVSYSTVLKGMAPLFVMIWGLALGVQPFRLETLCAFITIAVGLLLAVTGESVAAANLSNHVSAGFWAQLCSALLSGFRWMITQVFIKGQSISKQRFSSFFRVRPLGRGLSSMETISLTAPYTFYCVFPFLTLLEGPPLLRYLFDASLSEIAVLLTGLIIIGTCVYILLWSEYELVKVTSSQTVSVGFVLKEVLVLLVGVILLKERLSKATLVGFVIAQCGIVAYGLQTKREILDQNDF